MADLRLRLTCLNPPPATWGGEPTEFGLQDRAGAVHPGTALPDGALLFELSVALPRFGGDFVHGPPSGRFLYLSYRHRRAGAPWIGRIKIPLAGITPERAAAGVWAATISALRPDGRRAWATVPPRDGWATLH